MAELRHDGLDAPCPPRTDLRMMNCLRPHRSSRRRLFLRGVKGNRRHCCQTAAEVTPSRRHYKAHRPAASWRKPAVKKISTPDRATPGSARFRAFSRRIAGFGRDRRDFGHFLAELLIFAGFGEIFAQIGAGHPRRSPVPSVNRPFY